MKVTVRTQGTLNVEKLVEVLLKSKYIQKGKH